MALSTFPSPALLSFLEYLEVEKNVSQLTIRNYSHYLRRFIDWFTQHGYQDLKELTPEVLRSYRVYLARYEDAVGRTLSKKTQSYHVIAMRSWLKFLIKNDLPVMHPEKIELPKSESKTMKFLNINQIERLLAQPALSAEGGLRDKALLEVLFSTGLRVSEIVSLNRDQVDASRREFGVIGKGRRQRVVFFVRSIRVLAGEVAELAPRQLATHLHSLFSRSSRRLGGRRRNAVITSECSALSG